MPTKALARRLARLGERQAADQVGRIVIIQPDDWPPAVLAAYEAACAAHDLDRQADIIEAQTGERPVFRRAGAGGIRDPRLDIAVIEVRRTRGPDR